MIRQLGADPVATDFHVFLLEGSRDARAAAVMNNTHRTALAQGCPAVKVRDAVLAPDAQQSLGLPGIG
jgi:hypothetical protein